MDNYINLFETNLKAASPTSVALFNYSFSTLLNFKLKKHDRYEIALERNYSLLKEMVPPIGFVDWFTRQEYSQSIWMNITRKVASTSDLDQVVNDLDRSLRRIAHQEVKLKQPTSTWRLIHLTNPKIPKRYDAFNTEYLICATDIMTLDFSFAEPGSYVLLEIELDTSAKVIPTGIASVNFRSDIILIPGNELTTIEKISSEVAFITNYLLEKTGSNLSASLLKLDLMENRTLDFYKIKVVYPF